MLGSTYTGFDLGGDNKEVVIFGSDGCLITGAGSPDIARHEGMLVNYLSLMSRSLAIRQVAQGTALHAY